MLVGFSFSHREDPQPDPPTPAYPDKGPCAQVDSKVDVISDLFLFPTVNEQDASALARVCRFTVVSVTDWISNMF